MAAVTRRSYAGAAPACTLTNSITAGDTSALLTGTVTAWNNTANGPFYMVIDPGLVTEEKVLVGSRTGSSLSSITRGVDGTTAASHSAGATCYPVFTAIDADEANRLAAVMTTRGDLVTLNSSGDPARIALGASGRVLKSDGTDATWAISPETDLITTKGDLLVGTAADTLARQGVGANGSVLMADSAQTNGIVWSTAQTSDRNSIINGGFDVWQRGTSFSSPASAAFTSDRWSIVYDGSGATRTISQQTFTPGTGVTTGHEGRFFYRYDQSVAGSGGTYNLFQNRIEDVRTFAGQTVTISFYGKAATNTSLVKLNFEQNFGSGGSPSADVSTDIASTNFGLTTSWQRFTVTTTVPSISGKTIGTTTSGYLGLRFWIPVNSTFTIDIWGVQLEAGAVATPFEFEHIGVTLRKCQRYYFLLVSGATKSFGVGANITASEMQLHAYFPTTMRATPTLVATSGTNYYDFVRNGADDLFNSLTIVQASTTGAGIGNATEISGTAGHAGRLVTNDANASIAFSAEL